MLKRLLVSTFLSFSFAEAGPPPYPRLHMPESEYAGHILQLKKLNPSCKTFIVEKYRFLGEHAIKSDANELGVNYRTAFLGNVTVYEIVRPDLVVQVIKYEKQNSRSGVYRSCKI